MAPLYSANSRDTRPAALQVYAQPVILYAAPMGKAARAIIIEQGKILVMYRDKYGSKYFTLIGGRVNQDETSEQALVREVREETGLVVTSAQLVFTEEHGAPYNDQDIFLCQVAAHDAVVIQEASEEGEMNKLGVNTHQPVWVAVHAFDHLPFRTPLLHKAVLAGLRKGFPSRPVKLEEARPPFLRRLKKKLRKQFR